MENKTEAAKPQPSDAKIMAQLFRVLNWSVLPFWALMMVAPKWSVTQKLLKSNLIFTFLGAAYTFLLGYSLTKGEGKGGNFTTLSGVTKLLGNRYGAITGWTHFLAFDLFVGRWIYFDSLERGKPARFSLFFTLMAGPFGLLNYLTWRGKAKNAK